MYPVIKIIVKIRRSILIYKNIVTIQTDTKLFQQAISNLIENAVLYSKEGTDIDISFPIEYLDNTKFKTTENGSEVTDATAVDVLLKEYPFYHL